MAKTTLRSTGQGIKKKIRKKPKKKAPPGNFLTELAGGWTRKEADEFLESLEPFDQVSAPAENKLTH
jgi:hypothetical protein